MVYVTSTPAADAKSGLGWTTHCIVLLKSDKSSHQGLHTQVLHLQSSVPMFDYKCYVGLQVLRWITSVGLHYVGCCLIWRTLLTLLTALYFGSHLSYWVGLQDRGG